MSEVSSQYHWWSITKVSHWASSSGVMIQHSVSLAWGLCSQTLLLSLIPAFCPFTSSEWFCIGLILLTQNRNTTFYQDSLEGRSVPRPHTKHTASHNGLDVTQGSEIGAPWVTAVRLCCYCPGSGVSAFLITARWEQEIGCKESNEYRISSNQRLCLYLWIFPHTEKSKKYPSLLESLFFSFFHSDSC